jgi:hypothetical protein
MASPSAGLRCRHCQVVEGETPTRRAGAPRCPTPTLFAPYVARFVPVMSIGKSNGLFHRLHAPTLLTTLYYRVPPPGAPAPVARPSCRPPAGRRTAVAWPCRCGQARERRVRTREVPVLNALVHAEARRERAGRCQGKGCGTRAAAGCTGEMLTQDGHVSPHSGPAGEPSGQRRDDGCMVPPQRSVGDGATPHQARSGGGPREGFLADTGWCNGRWDCRKFQMPEDLPDHLAVREDAGEAQRPPDTRASEPERVQTPAGAAAPSSSAATRCSPLAHPHPAGVASG